MIGWLIGVFGRLLGLALYLATLPLHVVMIILLTPVAIALSIIDIPVWILTGKGFVTSEFVFEWAEWHLDRIFS